MIESVDIVAGLAWGDEGKGKITAHLANTRKYNFVCRWAGGSNAGHTVHVDGQKFVTHIIPSGVFHGIKSVIGPGCVLHVEDFLEEIRYLKEAGFKPASLVKIDPRCHIISKEHKTEDSGQHGQSLGTTGRGIGPCYSDKYRRTGMRAEKVPSLTPYLQKEPIFGDILAEGAQGLWLDIDQGAYPYVTSSHTSPYAACSLGFSPQRVRNIYGVVKAYDTRVGADPDFPDTLMECPIRKKIAQIGGEFGATTGRPRKVNWLSLPHLIKALELTEPTHLIINKIDVLEDVGAFNLIGTDGMLITCANREHFESTVTQQLALALMGYRTPRVIFSDAPDDQSLKLQK